MIIEIIVIIFVLFGLHFYRKHYVKPKQLMMWYRRTLEEMGYQVYCYPYCPFKITLSERQKMNQIQHHDSFYDQKTKFPNFDVVVSNIADRITLTICNPRLIKYFFSPEKTNIFQKCHLNKVGLGLVLGSTMILSQGEIWKRKRRIISSVFNFNFIIRNIQKMNKICDEMLDQIERNHINSSNNKIKIELKPLFANLASSIVIQIFFGSEGIKSKIEGYTINQYLSNLLKQSRVQSNNPFVLLLGDLMYRYGPQKYRSLKRKTELLKKVVGDIIKTQVQSMPKVRRQQKYETILQGLYYLKSQKGYIDSLDENQMIEELCGFITASSDTTANFINMVMFYLNQNPEVEKKLKFDITQYVKGNHIGYEELKKMKYLEKIQLQTTRMYGPATNIFLREAVSDTTLDNIPILKGTCLKIQMLASHYNQKYFKQPYKFNPERWLDQEQLDPFVFGGFGGGPRTCPGKHLAYLLTKIVVIKLMKRYSSIQIDRSSRIDFVVRGIYTPSTFLSVLTKNK